MNILVCVAASRTLDIKDKVGLSSLNSKQRCSACHNEPRKTRLTSNDATTRSNGVWPPSIPYTALGSPIATSQGRERMRLLVALCRARQKVNSEPQNLFLPGRMCECVCAHGPVPTLGSDSLSLSCHVTLCLLAFLHLVVPCSVSVSSGYSVVSDEIKSPTILSPGSCGEEWRGRFQCVMATAVRVPCCLSCSSISL